MADFCKQCNAELFGREESDFPGTDPTTLAEHKFNVELCEGCGFIIVGAQGECVALDCPKHGEENRRELERNH